MKRIFVYTTQRWASFLLLAALVIYCIGWQADGSGGMAFKSLLLAVGAYALLSIRFIQLSRANAYVIYLVASVIMLLELSLRFWPRLTPTELMMYLEPGVRREVAKQRGLFTDMAGSGMLYFYQPHAVLPSFPDSKFDAHGFRNSVEWVAAPDLVLLGDSITIALGAKKDLGDLFREDGKSVINLGMGGYGPQQYQDSFAKFIKNGGIRPKSVSMIFFVGNDFRNALEYEQIVAKGEDYRKYLGEAESPIKFGPYTPRLLRLVEGWRHYNSWRQRTAVDDKIVPLPYKNIKINYLWPPPAIVPSDHTWQIVAESLKTLKADVEATGACLSIYMMPSPTNLYSQFTGGFQEEDRAYATSLKTISDFAGANGIDLFDLVPGLRRAIKKEFIFLSDSDTHFNTAGVVALYDIMKATKPLFCRPN